MNVVTSARSHSGIVPSGHSSINNRLPLRLSGGNRVKDGRTVGSAANPQGSVEAIGGSSRAPFATNPSFP